MSGVGTLVRIRMKPTVKRYTVALWSKLRAHPVRNILIGGVCVVLAVAGMTVNPRHPFSKELRLVDDYLAALQNGDAATAIEIADGGEQQRSYSCGKDCAPDDSFLTDKAIQSDWEYENLMLGREFHGDSDYLITNVYATITHGDRHIISEFEVANDDGQTWLQSPYTIVNMAEFGLDSVSVDGATASIGANSDINSEHFAASIDHFVFPGPHRVSAGSKMYQLSGHSTDVLWPSEVVSKPLEHWPEATLTDKAQTAAQQQFKNHLDECAAQSTVAPPDCPFGSDSDWIIETSEDTYANVEDVAWDITAYPQLDFRPERMNLEEQDEIMSLNFSTAERGYAVVTANSRDGSFKAECPIQTEYVSVSVPEPMKFEFSSFQTNYGECVEYA